MIDVHSDLITLSYENKKEFSKQLELYKVANFEEIFIVNFVDPDMDNPFEVFENQEKDFDFDNFPFRFKKVVEGISFLKPEQIHLLKDYNYNIVNLAWNEENIYAGGAYSDGELTEEGIKVIEFLLDNNIILDFAHLNKKSFMQAKQYYNKPIFVSHTGIRNFASNLRTIDDEQLEIIKESNGLIGISVIKQFLTDKDSDVIDFINQIKYVRDKIGIEHVCFGLDFCHYFSGKENNPVSGLENISVFKDIEKQFLNNGFTVEEFELISNQNVNNFFNN